MESKPGRRLRIAYVSMYNPTDRTAWSGSAHYIARALAKHCGDVVVVEPPPFGRNLPQRLVRRIEYTRRIAQDLTRQRADIIFSPQSQTTLALLPRLGVPVVLFSDTTWRLYHNYYPSHAYGAAWKWRLRDVLERLAFARSDLLVFGSEWAAGSAERDYHILPCRIRVAPFGANIDAPPPADAVLQTTTSGECRLLLIGVDWERKGGAVAFETLVELERRGIKARLTICGCVPPQGYTHPRMEVIPFLDKSKPEDSDRFAALLTGAHFLILPTRAECAGVVIAEANAFGIPALATDTGGVPSMIEEGINGFLLPLDATGDDYADHIQRVYRDAAAYRALVRSSRQRYDDRLNWDAWGRSMSEMLAPFRSGN